MRRLGLYLGRLPGFDKGGFDRRELAACVRAADECGYDSFWLPETWDREAFSLLAELAKSTNRIGLGTGIINVFSRSPALIAMSAATLDELSEGRFRLGLGTSGAGVIERFHGLKYEKSLTRLNETIQIVRALIAGEQTSLHGECFEVEGFKLGFKPFRPQLPIYVAALAPKSLYRLGQIADGWLPAHWPVSQFEDGVKQIAEGARAAGRDIKSLEIAPFVNVVVSEESTRARRLARLPLAYYIGGMGSYYHASLSRLGFGAEANRIQQLWSMGNRKEAIQAVTDSMVDAVAIVGGIDHCRDRLDRLYGLGVTLPLVPIPSEGTVADKCRTIEALIQ